MLVRFDLGSGSSFNTTAGAWQSGSYRNTSSQANLVNNASATWYITGVHLEVGEQATPFEHRSYGDELARCQRYYNRSGTKSIEGYQGLTGYVRGVTVPYSFPVEMRATPTRSTITQGTMLNVRGSSTSYAGILAVNKYGGSAQVETNNSTGRFQYVGFEEAFDAEL